MRTFVLTTLAVLLLTESSFSNKISPREAQALEQFRTMVKSFLQQPYQNEDWFLISWIRARDFNLNEAKELLTKALEWRKENQIDTILQVPELQRLEKTFPFSIDAVDIEGRPVLEYSLGKWDIRKAVLSGRTKGLKTFQPYMNEKMMEKLRQTSKIPGKDISQWVSIIDMNGFSTRTHGCLACLSGLSDTIALMENYYPSRINQTIMINTPKSFDNILRILKSIVPPEKLELVKIFGHNKNDWGPVITNLIPDSSVLNHYGLGNRVSRKSN